MDSSLYVQTVMVSLTGQLSITLIPKQDEKIKKVRLDDKNFFLSSVTNDGTDGTGVFGFYILSETTTDFSVELEAAKAQQAALVPEVLSVEGAEQESPTDAVNDVVIEVEAASGQ